MITTSYNYSSGSGFVYDNTKIGFGSGHANLILVPDPGKTFTPTISASSYDATELEYAAGVLRQLDKRPANATYYAAFTAMLNANWGNGSLVVSPSNGAAISGGFLNLTGSTNKYVTFDPVANADSLQTGTVEIVVKPNYSGTPTDNQNFYFVSSAALNAHNAITIQHASTGQLYFILYDGSGLFTFVSGVAWSPVAGTSYTIRIKWDGNAGANSIAVDGVQTASNATTFTRSGAVAYGTIGGPTDGTPGNANFSVSNLSVYSTAVSPASPVLSPTIYLDATATLPLFTYAGAGALQAFTASTIVNTNAVRYILNGKYWNGSAWVTSDLSYTQACSAALVMANIATLPALGTLQVLALYQGGSVQASLASLSVTYTGQTYPIDNPSIAPNTPLSMDQMSRFVAVTAAAGSDAVQFYLLIGSTRYWWDGFVWGVSDGTLAQSNSAGDIQDNADQLPITTGAFVTPYALLHSASGVTTPSITSLLVTYDYFGPEPSGPNFCTVFGYIINETGSVVPGAKVTITNPTTFFNSGLVEAQGAFTVTADSTGYFSITLAETTTVSRLLTWTVVYPATDGRTSGGTPNTAYTFGRTMIPNQPSANIADLTFGA